VGSQDFNNVQNTSDGIVILVTRQPVYSWISSKKHLPAINCKNCPCFDSLISLKFNIQIKINQEINMEKSNSIEKHNLTWPKFSFKVKHPCTCRRCRNTRVSKLSNFSFTAELKCPQCRSRDTRVSKCPNGGLFNRVFRKAHSCETCYSRFWIFRPFRMLIFTGVILSIYNYLSPLI
jgi:hypothetical protein